jgi:hypothetical protein
MESTSVSMHIQAGRGGKPRTYLPYVAPQQLASPDTPHAPQHRAQVSGTTAELLKRAPASEGFALEPRGTVEVKGKVRTAQQLLRGCKLRPLTGHRCSRLTTHDSTLVTPLHPPAGDNDDILAHAGRPAEPSR